MRRYQSLQIDGKIPFYDQMVIHTDFWDLQSAKQNDIVSATDAESSTKLLLTAKDEKFNIAVFSAELGQTVSMITKAAKAIDTVFRSLRKGDLRSAGKAVNITISSRKQTKYRRQMGLAKTKTDIDQALASGVLLVQYGIKPLIQDVVGAAEQLAQHHMGSQWSFCRAKVRKKDSIGFSSDTYGIAVTGAWKIDYSCSYTCRFSADTDIHLITKLGLTNPAVVLWEKLPWSFVIDWFIPVGDFLSSLDATNGLRFVDGSKSTKLSVTSTISETFRLGSEQAGEQIEGNLQGGTSSEIFRRVVLSDFPSVSLPSFKNPISMTHAVNAVALLVGLKKGIYNPNLIGR